MPYRLDSDGTSLRGFTSSATKSFDTIAPSNIAVQSFRMSATVE
jgi:hypothetical protein